MSDMTPPALSKRQRERAKKNRTKINLAGGATAIAPTGQGVRPPAEDPRKTATEARIRACGATKDNAHDADQTDDITRCISAVLDAPSQADLRGDLRDLWGGLLAMTREYNSRKLSINASPQSSSLPMLPEPMQTDQSHTIDNRTSEERVADAIRAYRHWWGKIKALPVPQMIWVIRAALGGNIGGLGTELWRDAKPTAKGRLMVQALLALHRAGGK